MTRRTGLSTTLTLLCGLAATSSQADDLFIDDVIVFQDLLCVGFACLSGESEIPGRSGLKLNDQNMAILLDDSSTNVNAPKNDWQITINDSALFGESFIRIDDVTNGTSPFKLAAFSPTNAMVINFSGNLGLGTAFPLEEIHIVDGLDSSVRLARDASSGFPARVWDVSNTLQGFKIVDETAGTTPFSMASASATDSIVVTQAGNIGLGENTPDGKLHTKGPGVQLAYFESSDGNAVQVRFRTDSENRRFLAVNNANQVKSQIIFKDDEVLITGATDSGANRWLSIGPAGIVSRGPTCGAPCDLTFDPEVFTVPPIAERAAYMWENKHLPAVGPTSPDQPFNLTEKSGAMLHELEIAHIYIEALHNRLEAQEARIAALEAQAD